MNRKTMTQKIFIAALAVVAAVAGGSTLAAPTAQVVAGQTSVELDPGFVDALVSLGIAPAPIGPGALTELQLRYPIPGGALDLGSLAGDIFHLGGLSLSTEMTQVDLLNFVISTTGAPVLSGIVTVNGDVVDRLDLFDLALSGAGVAVEGSTVTISNVGVALTDGAAETLSNVFGAPGAIPGGFAVGVATVVAQAAPSMEGPGDEEADDEADDVEADDADDSEYDDFGRGPRGARWGR